ncbi:MAG: aspartate aminotransferase family protein [Candidatus Paracaedibacteraceae bacterium]|nr:aspartate aminotransferase family protein [Candidatus Paracaedibacteraceae bacterium]
MSNVSAMIKKSEVDYSTEKIQERNNIFVCHPWSPMNTNHSKLMLFRGKGYRVWDVNGKSYIDCCSLNSTCGYANDDISKPIYQQLLKFHGIDLSLASNEPVGELSEKLASLLPKELSRTLFVNSGSEGVEAAIFIAASYWEQIEQPRYRLVSFADGYHGSTFGARSISQLPRIVQPFGSLISSTYVQLPAASKDMRKPELLASLLEKFEKALKNEEQPPMAVIVEPFLNVGGSVQFPVGFLAGLRKLCDEAGALLILDEVFTAYARTGKMFAFEHESITPDILVSSKGLAGGYMPITAVTMKEKIHATFDKDIHIGGVRYGHTTSGHAVACVAALATLDLIERENLCERAELFGKQLISEFSVFAGRGDIIDVRGIGLIFVIEMSSYEMCSKFKFLAQEKGLLVRQSGVTIKVVPPLIVDSQGIEEISHIIKLCLEQGGFI